MGKLIIVFTTLALTQSVFSQETPQERENNRVRAAMQYLKGVYVQVVIGDNENKPIDAESFRAEIELKLRSAGIKVQSREAWESADGTTGRLIVGLHYGSRKISNGYPYVAYALLEQKVTLDCESGHYTSATVWREDGLGYSSERDIQSAIRNGALEYTSIFANLYLSAHEK